MASHSQTWTSLLVLTLVFSTIHASFAARHLLDTTKASTPEAVPVTSKPKNKAILAFSAPKPVTTAIPATSPPKSSTPSIPITIPTITFPPIYNSIPGIPQFPTIPTIFAPFAFIPNIPIVSSTLPPTSSMPGVSTIPAVIPRIPGFGDLAIPSPPATTNP